MAKKKALFGVSNYHKRTPKKRPGRIRKKHGPRANKRKSIKAKADETYNDYIDVFNFWWRHQTRYL